MLSPRSIFFKWIGLAAFSCRLLAVERTAIATSNEALHYLRMVTMTRRLADSPRHCMSTPMRPPHMAIAGLRGLRRVNTTRQSKTSGKY